MSRLKILQVIPDLTVGSGGPQTAVRQLSRVLAARGHDVTIFTTDGEWGGGHLPVLPNVGYREHGYTVYYFPAQWPRRYVVSWPFLRSMSRSVANFDVVHIHSVFLFTTLAACLYARRARIPYIVRPHGTLDPFLMRRKRLLKYLYLRLIERRNLDTAYAIHYTTEDEASLAGPLGIKARPAIIPLGVNPDEFSPDAAPTSLRAKFPHLSARKWILFYGRINFKKGLDLLIPAFAKIVGSGCDAQLFIVGPDNEGYGTKVRRWVSEYSLNDRVTILPAVTGHERISVLRSADVFVLPSYTENFGLSVVEAMASGTPVVISNRVNIHRDVTTAGAGIVTDLVIDEIAAAMAKVISHADFAHDLSTRGQVLVRDRYSWESIAGQIEDLYSEMVQGD